MVGELATEDGTGRSSGHAPSSIGVSIHPGHRALTRTP